MDIPEVADRRTSVHYPTRFRADYDSTAQVYKFGFSGLTGGAGP
jgi:hypothetical protein